MDPNKDAQSPATSEPFNNFPPNTTQPTAPQPAPTTTHPPKDQSQYMSPSQQSAQPQPYQSQSQPIPPRPPITATPYDEPQTYSGTGGALPNQNPSKGSKKKPLLVGAGLLAIVVLLGLGAVFGLYLPNKPENVWSAGLTRSGQTVDKLVINSTDEKKIATVRNSELSGSAEANVDGKTYKGSFNSKYDANQADSNFTYTTDGQATDFNLKLLTDLAEGQEFPNIYFQITGLSALGADQYFPEVAQYEGKWISVSSDYLKSVLPTEATESDKQEQFTQKDAAELARIVSATSKDYIFSNDPNKAVLIRKNFVGTEKIENNITANRYTVSINKGNAKKYCQALIESFVSADAYKRIPGVNTETIDEDKKSAITECQQSVDNDIKDSDDFDMWIDKKRKLINKVRFTDTEDKGTYVEFGQTYTKGDIIPLFMTMHSDEDKYDGKVTLEVDTKKSITKGSLAFDQKDQDAYNVKASFEFKPFEGDVKVDKPADATPIEKIMESLGLNSSDLDSSELEDMSEAPITEL